ncbi:MAG: UvrD-helicase domain-containing protein [Candidatus Kerfeldbacteria bacterium]|nr:UvrD-helicase domain-containing protein [Candidatus Kerfeldbacteria bacterium]
MPTKYIIKKTFDPKVFKVDYQQELNQEQLDVVLHGDGPCLVLAGAGSGKTRTIVYRVAYLVEKGVKPQNILLVTFTNKAAKEMLFRVEQLLGVFPKSLWGGTFHHVANLLLRKYAPKIGFDHNFTILDEEDSKDLLSVCVKALGIDPKKRRFPSTGVISALISLSANMGLGVEELVSEAKPEFMKVMPDLVRVAEEYEHRKRRNNAMDFDDLLTHLLTLLRDHDDIRRHLSQQFRYILVDEYQDTNHLQAEVVRLLSEVHGNILVVGDDAQSIYSFRGADIDNILNFPKVFTGCRTFKLETNYRSTQPILDVANEVIKHNVAQFPKKLHHVRSGRLRPAMVPAVSDEQEAEFIAQKILELRDDGVPLHEVAVLFRAAYHSQALEFELTHRDIPYEYRGGVRFFDRAHIKDVLAHLKIVANPKDEVAFLRVLKLQVGIGEQTAGQIFDRVQADSPGAEERHPLEVVFETMSVLPRAEKGWQTFRSTMTGLIGEPAANPETLIHLIIDSDYRDYLRNQYPDAADRVEDLEQLALFAGKYDSLDKFLAEVSLQESFGLVGGEPAEGNDEKIVLTTIHQAKGLEWRTVFVMHLSEQYFPNPRALTEDGGLEEERRLFYVAVTRAKEYLFLTYSLASGYRTMSMHLNTPSPFLKEIPERLLEPYQIEETEVALEDSLIDPDQVIELDEDGQPKGILDRVLQATGKRKRRGRGAT